MFLSGGDFVKKIGLCIVILSMLLSACAAVPTFETLEGVELNEAPVKKRMAVTLPEEASVQTVNGENGRIYFCDGYEILLETMSSGDLNRTLLSLTGFGKDSLTLIQTKRNGNDCYECAWTSAGEGGDQVGRTAVIDHGGYHYCLSMTAPSDSASAIQTVWQDVLDSLQLLES